MENNGNKGFQGGNKGNVPQQTQVKNNGLKSFFKDHLAAIGIGAGVVVSAVGGFWIVKKIRAKKAAAAATAAPEQPAEGAQKQETK